MKVGEEEGPGEGKGVRGDGLLWAGTGQGRDLGLGSVLGAS